MARVTIPSNGSGSASGIIVADARPANPAVGTIRIGAPYVATTALPVTSGLVYDYNAKSITGKTDGQALTTWPDALGGVALSVVGSTPTYRANVLNGGPVVAFDGVDDTIGSSSVTVTTTPNTEVYVVRLRNTNAGNVVANTNGNHILLPSTTGTNAKWNAYAGSPLSSPKTVVVDEWVLAFVTFGNSGSIRVNGLVTNGSVGASTRAGLTLGAYGLASGTPNGFANIEVARIAVYNRALTSTEIASIEAEFKPAYGLSF